MTNPFRNIFKRPANAGGKEANMAEQDPAAAGGDNPITLDELRGMIAEIVQPLSQKVASLADNQKVIADTLAQQPGGDRAAKDQAAASAKSLTAADVVKLLDERDQKQQ